MIGAKVNVKAYAAKGKSKRNNEFSLEETLLTHYDTLSSKARKIALNYFEENVYGNNGFKDLLLEDAVQQYLFEVKAKVPFPGPSKEEAKFTFIDLFAGIGGFRMALQNLGGRCVFSSEWDKSAQQTYRANYGDIPFGDITKQEIQNLIPKKFDILCAGFPCQPFSRAGVSARNFLGLLHGFEHPTQGNLFFEIVKIAAKHQPKVLFLENVKNLKSHDNGNTFATIERMIKEIGYSFSSKIINAETEVPQRRERTYMVCFKNDKVNFEFPKFEGNSKKLGDYLEQEVSEYYTLSDAMWQGHIKRSKRNKDRGTGFTVSLADLNKPSNTIVARYYKDGKECLIAQPHNNPRMLTPRECARLQGFPETFLYHPSRKAAYQQFGNSVAVPIVKKIGLEIIKYLNL
jgi:DNA (cytosine-5)-methyltransferase 1